MGFADLGLSCNQPQASESLTLRRSHIAGKSPGGISTVPPRLTRRTNASTFRDASSFPVLGGDGGRVRVTLGEGSASLIPLPADMKTVVMYLGCVLGKSTPEEVVSLLLRCYATGEFRLGSGNSVHGLKPCLI
jgi:hypothetical protein